MSLQLSIATPQDLPAIVRSQYNAFHPHDTLHRLIYPSPDPVPESIIQRTIERQAKTMKDSHVTWLKITDPFTSEIIAAAKWIIWDPSSPSASSPHFPPSDSIPYWISTEEKGINSGNGVDDLSYVQWIVNGVYSRRRERIRGPLVLLDMCFCDPKHHRRGAGKILVEWGTKKADELGLTAFVEASFAGVRLYESCGFIITEDVCLDGGRMNEEWKKYGAVEYKFMVRDIKDADRRLKMATPKALRIE